MIDTNYSGESWNVESQSWNDVYSCKAKCLASKGESLATDHFLLMHKPVITSELDEVLKQLENGEYIFNFYLFVIEYDPDIDWVDGDTYVEIGSLENVLHQSFITSDRWDYPTGFFFK